MLRTKRTRGLKRTLHQALVADIHAHDMERVAAEARVRSMLDEAEFLDP